MDLKVKNNYTTTYPVNKNTPVSHLFTTPNPCNKNNKNRTVDIYKVYGIETEKTYYTKDVETNEITKQTLSQIPIFVNGSYTDSKGIPYGKRPLLSVGSVTVPRGTKIEEDTILDVKVPGIKELVKNLAGLIYFDC